MSETETREPGCTCIEVDRGSADRAALWEAVGTCPVHAGDTRWLTGLARLIDSDRYALYVEAKATDAELSRLRAVVEAVQALADEWDASGKKLAPDDDWGASVEATLRGDFLQEKASALRAALAPVSSSGEAESGEGREHETFAYGQSGYDGDACRTCRWEGPPGSAAQHRAETRSPAPVSSGGQADGEGRPDVPIAYRLGALADWCDSQRTSPTTADLRALAALAASTSARPVLSREAVRERLDGHWPTSCGCVCGAGFGGVVETTVLAQAAWRDHLADVLAGGEQDA